MTCCRILLSSLRLTAVRLPYRGYFAQLVTSQSTFIRIGPALLESWSLLDHGSSCSVKKGNLPRASVRFAQVEAQY